MTWMEFVAILEACFGPCVACVSLAYGAVRRHSPHVDVQYGDLRRHNSTYVNVRRCTVPKSPFRLRTTTHSARTHVAVWPRAAMYGAVSRRTLTQDTADAEIIC